jgi:hypothetical protein
LAGTTEKLVERLADEYPYDAEYVRAFLTSYPSIMGMYGEIAFASAGCTWEFAIIYRAKM